MWRSIAIKVRLVFRFVRKISAAFDHERARQLRLPFCRGRHGSIRRRRFPAAHLRALLFQNRLARKPYAVAFHRQHLHQHLVAFLQFVAYIRNAMFRHFADVQ